MLIVLMYMLVGCIFLFSGLWIFLYYGDYFAGGVGVFVGLLFIFFAILKILNKKQRW